MSAFLAVLAGLALLLVLYGMVGMLASGLVEFLLDITNTTEKLNYQERRSICIMSGVLWPIAFPLVIIFAVVLGTHILCREIYRASITLVKLYLRLSEKEPQ